MGLELTYNTVKNELLALAQLRRAELVAHFFRAVPGQYGEGDQFLGLSMAQQRQVTRKYQNLPLTETERLVQDAYHECRMTGLLVWVDQTEKAGAAGQNAILEHYLANRQNIDN